MVDNLIHLAPPLLSSPQIQIPRTPTTPSSSDTLYYSPSPFSAPQTIPAGVPDLVPLASIITMLSTLNETIRTIADNLAPTVTFKPDREGPSTSELTYAKATLGPWVSDVLLKERGRLRRNVVPGVAKMVICLILANTCHLLIDEWDPTDLDLSLVLRQAHYKILNNGKSFACPTIRPSPAFLIESPPTCAQWRSVTRKYFNPSSSKWGHLFKDNLLKVFSALHWSTKWPGSAMYSFDEGVNGLIEVVERLRMAIGEHYLSQELTTYLRNEAAPTPSFQQRWLDPLTSEERVAGTIGVGLLSARFETTTSAVCFASIVEPEYFARTTIVHLLSSRVAAPLWDSIKSRFRYA